MNNGRTAFDIGKKGETLAANLLKENGFFIAAKNYRSSVGEIDIIAENTDTVLFVEVKLRSADAGYLPRESVNKNKQKRLVFTAKNYIYRSKTTLKPRFDVIEIIQNKKENLQDAEVNWLKNAFGVTMNEFF